MTAPSPECPPEGQPPRVPSPVIVRATPMMAETLARFECKEWGIRYTRYVLWTWVLATRHDSVIVTLSGGKVVGVASARATAHDGVYVEEVIVAKSWRRQGVGTDLLREVIHLHPKTKFFGYCKVENRASRRMLENMGWTIHGAVLKDLFHGGHDYLKYVYGGA